MNRPLLFALLFALLGAAVFTGLRITSHDKDRASQLAHTASLAPRVATRPVPASRHDARLDSLKDASISWQQRVALCRQLITHETSRADVDFLFTLLHDTRSHAAEEWFVVANEIMETMRHEGAGASHYTAVLSSLAASRDAHPVIRDYAVQHLAMWLYPTLPGAPGETDPARRQSGLDAILALAADSSLSQTSVPGTSLMALADINDRADRETMEPVWNRLTPVITRWLEDGSATVTTRVSALQAVSRARVDALHPLVAQLATSPEAEPSVALSAVSALGYYGRPADAETIRRAATLRPRLAYAAAASLQRIQEH